MSTPPVKATSDTVVKALIHLLTEKGIIDGEEWKEAIRQVQAIDKEIQKKSN